MTPANQALRALIKAQCQDNARKRYSDYADYVVKGLKR